MFDKFKNMYDFKKQADAMKKQMEQIFAEHENKGIKVLMRGDNHIEKIEVDGIDDKRLKDVLNEAYKEVQKKVAKKMQGQLGDLKIPGF